MSLDELIEKEAQPQKGKKNWQEEWEKPGKEKEWGPNKWQDKTKSTGTWKASWKDNDQRQVRCRVRWEEVQLFLAVLVSGGKKNDWSGHQEEWKPKPRGDEWSANSWGAQPKSQAWEKWPQDKWEAPVRQTWRPTNEQEREDRWNSRNEGPAEGYGRAFDVRDRRGRERSRSPPRRNFYEEPPARGSIILVKNIPLGLDSRDRRLADSATGPVTSCKLSQDGTARISFERPEDAKKAVATFDHGELNGNIINVHIIN
eukprot:g26370.t1